MTPADIALAIVFLSLIFLFVLFIIYHIKEEYEFRKWLGELEQPVDSLLIKKGK